MIQKVLITGVTGSGGSYLAEYILNNIKGVKVIGTTRDHSSYRNIIDIKDRIDLQYLDLEDSLSVYGMLEKTLPDIIFHIASIANVRRSFNFPHEVITNNINITLNLLECIRLLKNKTGYNPVVQICSTSEVFGKVDPKNVPISETCPLNPINPYAVSKLTQDSMGYVYFLNYGMNVIRTRMFSYLNAKRADLFPTAMAKQILEVKRGKRDVVEHGNLNSIRSFIDVREAAESYWMAAIKGDAGEVYNIGSTESIKLDSLLHLLINKMDVPVKTVQNSNLLRPSDISIQIPDTTKFRNKTGWNPKIPFDQSLDFFIQEIYKYWDK